MPIGFTVEQGINHPDAQDARYKSSTTVEEGIDYQDGKERVDNRWNISG